MTRGEESRRTSIQTKSRGNQAHKKEDKRARREEEAYERSLNGRRGRKKGDGSIVRSVDDEHAQLAVYVDCSVTGYNVG